MKFKSFAPSSLAQTALLAASRRHGGGDHVIGLATCRLDELLNFTHNAE